MVRDSDVGLLIEALGEVSLRRAEDGRPFVLLEGERPLLPMEGTEAIVKLLLDFLCVGLVPSEVATSSAEALPASGRHGVPVGTLS